MSRKLPFLQSQVLELIYIRIHNNEHLTMGEISDITGYPTNSKILQNCLDSLIRKGYLLKRDENFSFNVPDSKNNFYKEIINKHVQEEKFEPNIDYLQRFKKAYQRPLLEYDEKTEILELNRTGVVHRWYGYLEDYPATVVQEKIAEFGLKKSDRVLDPYCGSGTTLVTGKMLGLNTYGIDANPLMCMVTEAKTTWDIDLKELKNTITDLIKKMTDGFKNLKEINIKNKFLETMPKRELNQWLSPILQKEVAYCKDLTEEIHNKKIKKLLSVAMGKSAFDASYVSLCPGTTFYPYVKKEPFYDIFCKKMIQIYHDLSLLAKFDSYGSSKIIEGDTRKASHYLEEESIDFLMCSPPYPNDLEYTRQTRLELYLHDFVKNMDDVQKLKKKMIKGSTKLIYKDDNSEQYISDIDEIISISKKIGVALKDKNWGFDYPKMIKEYFGNMYTSLYELKKLLKPNAPCLLVVGDQTYKNIVIPVAKLLCLIGRKLGYKSYTIESYRVRRSTTHTTPLPEEIVILKK